jgi:hypothetical protein
MILCGLKISTDGFEAVTAKNPARYAFCLIDHLGIGAMRRAQPWMRLE